MNTPQIHEEGGEKKRNEEKIYEEIKNIISQDFDLIEQDLIKTLRTNFKNENIDIKIYLGKLADFFHHQFTLRKNEQLKHHEKLETIAQIAKRKNIAENFSSLHDEQKDILITHLPKGDQPLNREEVSKQLKTIHEYISSF